MQPRSRQRTWPPCLGHLRCAAHLPGVKTAAKFKNRGASQGPAMKLQQMVGAAEWSVLSISERTPEGKCRECSYSCTSGIKRYYASRCIRKRAPQDYRRVQASPWFDACDLRRQLFCEAQAKLLENVFTTLKTKLVPTNFCRVFVHQLYR